MKASVTTITNLVLRSESPRRVHKVTTTAVASEAVCENTQYLFKTTNHLFWIRLAHLRCTYRWCHRPGLLRSQQSNASRSW